MWNKRSYFSSPAYSLLEWQGLWKCSGGRGLRQTVQRGLKKGLLVLYDLPAPNNWTRRRQIQSSECNYPYKGFVFVEILFWRVKSPDNNTIILQKPHTDPQSCRVGGVWQKVMWTGPQKGTLGFARSTHTQQLNSQTSNSVKWKQIPIIEGLLLVEIVFWRVKSPDNNKPIPSFYRRPIRIPSGRGLAKKVTWTLAWITSASTGRVA